MNAVRKTGALPECYRYSPGLRRGITGDNRALPGSDAGIDTVSAGGVTVYRGSAGTLPAFIGALLATTGAMPGRCRLSPGHYRRQPGLDRSQSGSVFTEEDITYTPPMYSDKHPTVEPFDITENGIRKLLLYLNPITEQGPDGQSPSSTPRLEARFGPSNIHEGRQLLQSISLASVCCKTMEHVIHSQVMKHLNTMVSSLTVRMVSGKDVPAKAARSGISQSCHIRQERLRDDNQRMPNDRLPGIAIPANLAY
ncbi:hypothetical protein DPMN_044324 [Dreissena polymorpha]|uniref:Uncharacterized protein n=1 Tax=Dreissena polymorpha TaxID=45954 RepID=A0A9D4D227_DREPO|nr:hypothetical protein DPMN_044324 [Dreissena polymorpha]